MRLFGSEGNKTPIYQIRQRAATFFLIVPLNNLFSKKYYKKNAAQIKKDGVKE